MVMSPELKERMRIGREKKLAERRALKEAGKLNPSRGDVIKSTFAENSDVVQLDKKLDLLISAVSKLVELQTADKSSVVATSSPFLPLAAAVNTGFSAHLEDSTYPKGYVPPAFRRIADEILSPEFGIRVSDFEDRTEFQLDVIVPEKYSSVSKADRAKGVKDIRSRIIPRGLGENGVRDWCNLIRRNLNKYYMAEGKQSPFQEAAL